jgi:hypothetical protein
MLDRLFRRCDRSLGRGDARKGEGQDQACAEADGNEDDERHGVAEVSPNASREKLAA